MRLRAPCWKTTAVWLAGALAAPHVALADVAPAGKRKKPGRDGAPASAAPDDETAAKEAVTDKASAPQGDAASGDEKAAPAKAKAPSGKSGPSVRWWGSYAFARGGSAGYRVREAADLRTTEEPADHVRAFFFHDDDAASVPRRGAKPRVKRQSDALYAEGAFAVAPKAALGFYALHGESLARAPEIAYRERFRVTHAALQGSWLVEKRLGVGLELGTAGIETSGRDGGPGQAGGYSYQTAAGSLWVHPLPQQEIVFTYHPGVHRQVPGGYVDEIGRFEARLMWREAERWSAHAVARRLFARQAHASLNDDAWAWQAGGAWRADARHVYGLALALESPFARRADALTLDNAGLLMLTAHAQVALDRGAWLEGGLGMGQPRHGDARGAYHHVTLGYGRPL